ncbi:MAG: hypothetical protein KKD00_02535 [Gammaproteobacteria bacterium]|nr:hypothetical protein [Gammaproteobacteria bacterium]
MVNFSLKTSTLGAVYCLLLVAVLPVSAQTLAQKKISAWDHQWTAAQQVDVIPLPQIPATVLSTSQNQQALSFDFPITVQKWLIASGQQVESGQPLAEITGPAIQSLNERLEIAEHHAQAAQSRVKNNQQRYQQGDITKETWLEWQHQVHQTGLDFAALQLQYQKLRTWQAKTTATGFQLAATQAGIVHFDSTATAGRQVIADTELLLLVPDSALQLEIRLPLQKQVSAITTEHCTLAIIWQSPQIQAQLRTWRSEPVTPQCQLAAGQIIAVQPQMPAIAFKIPLTSLVQNNGQDAVIVEGDPAAFLNVTVLSQEGDWLFVQGDLTGRRLATAHLAALKGQLVGMGAAE